MLMVAAMAVLGLAAQGCRVSEYPCRNGRCIPLDKYCNGHDDCTDSSDEPSYCTVCNRTYYGEVGKTYTLSPAKPRVNRMPYLCHLTFTANGRDNGDIVQVVLEKFEIGRLEDGLCDDGYMQVTELGRPLTEGGWCGKTSAPAPYFAESTTVTLTIRLMKPAPFQVELKYRMLRGVEAAARAGPPGLPVDRGSLVAGSYCGRTFDQCHQSRCVAQSPNYPGIYPRNITCLYIVRQRVIPTCKHAMISVAQNHLRLGRGNETGPAGVQCGLQDDRLIFYDGSSRSATRLAVHCAGPLPTIVSSGPSLLVEFRSSVFAAPSTAPSPLHGFQLQLSVVFADSDSLQYIRNNKCEFYVNGREPTKRRGEVRSPRHTLPPNTTCTYRLIGLPTDRVWIYFYSYTLHKSIVNITAPNNCTHRLKIFTGNRVLENTCTGPRLCDHSSLANQTRPTRPCSLQESYVTSSKVQIEYTTSIGTAMQPSSFRFRYEFVDTRLGGESAGSKCARIIRAKSGEVHSPRNVFMFGRGGARSLSCGYRIEAPSGQRIRLSIFNASFGEGTKCRSGADKHTSRPTCKPLGRAVMLVVSDLPWTDVVLQRACYCDNSIIPKISNSSVSPTVFLSSSRSLLINFTVTRFNVTEDFDDIYFHASFEAIRWADCSRRQRLTGSGGEVIVTWPPQDRMDVACQGLPWLVQAQPNRSLFLHTWGHFLPLNATTDNCPTTNRVLLYSGSPFRLSKVVCPSEKQDKEFAVHVFSEEWFAGSRPGRRAQFLVELVGREAGTASLSWLEISRPRATGLVAANRSMCLECRDLEACISTALRCDGRRHCPGGEDEVDCSIGSRLAVLAAAHGAAIAAAGAAALCGLLVIAALLARPKKPRRLPIADQLLLESSSTLSSS